MKELVGSNVFYNFYLEDPVKKIIGVERKIFWYRASTWLMIQWVTQTHITPWSWVIGPGVSWDQSDFDYLLLVPVWGNCVKEL